MCVRVCVSVCVCVCVCNIESSSKVEVFNICKCCKFPRPPTQPKRCQRRHLIYWICKYCFMQITTILGDIDWSQLLTYFYLFVAVLIFSYPPQIPPPSLFTYIWLSALSFFFSLFYLLSICLLLLLLSILSFPFSSSRKLSPNPSHRFLHLSRDSA